MAVYTRDKGPGNVSDGRVTMGNDSAERCWYSYKRVTRNRAMFGRVVSMRDTRPENVRETRV